MTWTPQYPCWYLVGEGDPPPHEIWHDINRSAAHVIAVDGGVRHVMDAGLVPDVIMGDLDGIAPYRHHPMLADVPIVEMPDQYVCDMEKAVQYGLDHGMDHAILLAADGGPRPDHGRVNVDLLMLYASRVRMQMITRTMVLDGLCPESQGDEFLVQKDDVVSVVPSMAGARVTLDGVLYPLTNALLPPGSLGVGNRSMGERIQVKVQAGAVCLFRQRRETYA